MSKLILGLSYLIDFVPTGLGFLTKWFRERFREMFREKRFAISRNKMGRFACFAVSRNGPFWRNMFRETMKQHLHFAKQ